MWVIVQALIAYHLNALNATSFRSKLKNIDLLIRQSFYCQDGMVKQTSRYTVPLKSKKQCCGPTFWYGSGCRCGMRILASVPLTNRSGSRSCSFRQWSSRCRKKNFFMLIPFWAYIILQRQKVTKKSRNSRNQGSRFFFNFLLVYIRIRICTNILRIRMRIQEARKHMDIRIRNTGKKVNNRYCLS